MCCRNDVENEFNFVFFFPFYCELCNTSFSKIQIDIDFVNMDDAQKRSRLFTYEISWLSGESLGERKNALYQDNLYVIVVFCDSSFGIFVL